VKAGILSLGAWIPSLGLGCLGVDEAGAVPLEASIGKTDEGERIQTEVRLFQAAPELIRRAGRDDRAMLRSCPVPAGAGLIVPSLIRTSGRRVNCSRPRTCTFRSRATGHHRQVPGW
jgi:hypothetical protein